MFIRPATPADASVLNELSAQTAREAFGPPHNAAELLDEYVRSAFSVALLEAELTDPKATFFLACLPDGTPVGFAILRRHAPPRRMATRNAVELQRIYLLQAYTGQGQGRLLMQHCLDWAKAQGFAALWLGVWERNQRAIGFYQKMGFERIGYHFFQFGSERQRDFWLQKHL